jgi:hypothetical protein
VFPCPTSFIEPWSKLSLLLVDSCVSSLSIVHHDLKQHNSLKWLMFSPNTKINIICITNFCLSCRQLSKNFRLSLLYFDFLVQQILSFS